MHKNVICILWLVLLLGMFSAAAAATHPEGIAYQKEAIPSYPDPDGKNSKAVLALYDFEENFGFETVINYGNGNNNWGWYWEPGSSQTNSIMMYEYDQNYAADTWAFTVKFYCLAGQTYWVGFDQRVGNSSYPERLKVTVGTAQTKVSQTTTLWDNNNLTNTTWTPRTSSNFVPTTTGFYYFAFNCYSARDMFILAVDNVTINGPAMQCYSVQSGYWSDPNTWSTGIVPTSADDVVIQNGHTIIVDSDRVTYDPPYDGLYDYESQAGANSLNVQAGGALIIDSEAVLGVATDVTNSGTITWNAGSSSSTGYTTLLFVGGDFTNNSTGTINCSAAYSTIYFNGAVAQTFTNNGSVTGLIYTLGIENIYGVTLAGTNQIPAFRVNLFTGQVTNASQLTLGSSGTSAMVQVGNVEQDNPAGSFDEIPTYADGCFIQLLYASGNSNYSTGYEVPADGVIDFMLVYMNSGTQYTLTLTQDIYISGYFDNNTMEDEVLFQSGRLYFNGYALVYNAEWFYISGQGTDYVDDFAVEIDKVTQYDVDGTGNGYTFNTTWVTYGTQSGGVDLTFYNPTEWTSAVPTVDVYYSEDGGVTWTLYESGATVNDGYVTLTDVNDLGSTTNNRIWAFYIVDPPLPIELSSFTASISATNFVNLMWITQSETGVSGFYVLRNTTDDLATALTLSELIPATNTAQQQTYMYTDNELYEDGTYWYWLQNLDLDGTVDFHGPISVAWTSGGSDIPNIPLVTELRAVYPNPFNPRAYIPFSLKESATVNFEIYNSRGQLVRRIPIGDKAAGHHQTEWDGRDDQGRDCSTGVYHIHMTAGTESFFRKAVLLK